MSILTGKEQNAMLSVAMALNIPVDWLYNIIQFESGFNPKIKNRLSSARGLIQFVDGTARQLGYIDSLDLVNKNPTIEAQLLGPVYNYFRQYAPFTNKQSFYLSVFYPPARNWPLNTNFPDNVIKVNPGIVTVADYIRKVEKSGQLKPLPMLLALIVGTYYLLKNRKRKGE